MNLEIIYSKSSLSFLAKNTSNITRDESDQLIIKAVKKIYKISIESIDLKALKGEKGVYRIRKGDIRIIFRLDKDGNISVASVNNIDFRDSIYRKS
jgi:mRNA-degrading endonuclease RelE of RelBE toxin-antitoxin system